MISQVSKVGFPIRKSSDQRVFAPPRRLSQRITSFIACACQGIHQLPLRHLIILIANAHRFLVPHDPCPKSLATFWGHASATNGLGRKDQLLEICSMAAVRQTNHLRGIERPLRRTALINTQILLNTLMERILQIQIPMAEPEQIFSSQCHTEQADRYSANRKPFFFQ